MGKLITEILGEIEGGTFVGDLSEALDKVVEAVMETNRAGKINIALTITPTGRASVKLDAAFSAKEPENTRASTTFFVGKNNQLQRNDPAQREMELKVVRMPDGDLRKVGVDAAE
jgi:hypothetical protein